MAAMMAASSVHEPVGDSAATLAAVAVVAYALEK